MILICIHMFMLFIWNYIGNANASVNGYLYYKILYKISLKCTHDL